MSALEYVTQGITQRLLSCGKAACGKHKVAKTHFLVQLPQPAKERFQADLKGVSLLLSIADLDTTCPYKAQNVTTGTTVSSFPRNK